MKSESEIISEYEQQMDALMGTEDIVHRKADELLIRLLEDIGLAEVSAAWQRVEIRNGKFWYD